MSTTSFQVCILLVLLVFLTLNQSAVANSIHRSGLLNSPALVQDEADRGQLKMTPVEESLFYEPLDDELPLPDTWHDKFRPSYIKTIPVIHLRSGIIEMRPYKKRTIPLELQKALYAHGIVGRR